MAIASPPQTEDAVDYRRWKWTGDDLIRLGALGVLPANRKFELMDGEIIEIMPPSPYHAALVGHLSSFLMRVAWSSAAHVRPENPIRLTPHFDPQPDLAVVRGAALDFKDRFPTAAETLLLVEIADSSLAYDRGFKLQSYAASGVLEYWVVNLQDTQVEVYREPDGQAYRSLRIHKPGETVTPLEAPETPIPVNVLLGRE